jgi:hypothetical protein
MDHKEMWDRFIRFRALTAVRLLWPATDEAIIPIHAVGTKLRLIHLHGDLVHVMG